MRLGRRTTECQKLRPHTPQDPKLVLGDVIVSNVTLEALDVDGVLTSLQSAIPDQHGTSSAQLVNATVSTGAEGVKPTKQCRPKQKL